jgi:hypothetical protein
MHPVAELLSLTLSVCEPPHTCHFLSFGCNLQKVTDKLVGLCGGNIAAAEFAADTLKKCCVSQWPALADLMSTKVQDSSSNSSSGKSSDFVLAAIDADLTLLCKTQPQQWRALVMMALVQADRPVPLPLLQLLWSAAAPHEAPSSATPALSSASTPLGNSRSEVAAPLLRLAETPLLNRTTAAAQV